MPIAKKPGVAGLLAFFTMATLALAPSLARAQEPLRWKFEEGQKLNYTTNQEMTLTATGAALGAAQNVTMTQTMEITWEVIGVNDDAGAVIRHKFERVKVKMTLPPPIGGFEYDTRSDAAPAGLGAMVAPVYKAITGADFELTMTSRGEIKDVKIPDEVANVLKASQGAMALGEMATPEGFKKLLSHGELLLPENPLKPGDVTTTKIEVNNPMAGKQIIETTYKYEGTKEVEGVKYAVFSPSVKMSAEGTPQMQMKVTEQDSSGETLFNVEEGRLHSSTLDQMVKIDVTVGGQTIQQNIDQTIEVKVTPEEDVGEEAAEESEARATAPQN